MLNLTEAFDCGQRSKNMDRVQAERNLYSVCGIHSITVSSPSVCGTDTYRYWCPESDPPHDVTQSFWDGYDNEA